jgi:GT2 family glycosyltransferase
VIIVNDYPPESLQPDLDNMPVTLLENNINLGFGGTVNRGIEAAKNQFIMLLNTDVVLNNNSYLHAVDAFKNQADLFAVSFAQIEKDGSIVGKNKIYWKHGFFQHKKADDLNSGINGWAEGGTCVIDRDKFLKLGGFDPIYKPFYWEDLDLSYRAWKANYSIIFDPTIRVEHHHESTIGKYFMSSYVQEIAFRNQLIFIWKNITNLRYRIIHFTYLFPLMLYFLIRGQSIYLRGFVDALSMIKQIKKSQNEAIKHMSVKDQEILACFKDH